MRRAGPVFLIILLSTVTVLSLPPTEYQVKAALVFNFLRFVDLPAQRIFNNKIHLCSFENNPLSQELKLLDNRQIGENRIVYMELKEDNLEKCSVFIVNKRGKEELNSLLEKVYQMGILTISDIDGFGELGVVINMFVQDEKVKYEINLDAADKTGVKISSRLLAIARIIQKKK